MPYYVTELCVDVMDRSCVAVCPVDCIYEGDREVYINPDECIDCGACEPTCPVNAIVFGEDLEEGEQGAVTRAEQWVAEHAATGGAKTRGRIGVDHADIRALPRKDALT